jgi:hypothetical protein
LGSARSTAAAATRSWSSTRSSRAALGGSERTHLSSPCPSVALPSHESRAASGRPAPMSEGACFR